MSKKTNSLNSHEALGRRFEELIVAALSKVPEVPQDQSFRDLVVEEGLRIVGESLTRDRIARLKAKEVRAFLEQLKRISRPEPTEEGSQPNSDTGSGDSKGEAGSEGLGLVA